jgi:hypothetical protein
MKPLILILFAFLSISATGDTSPTRQEMQPWWIKPGHIIMPTILTMAPQGAIAGIGQPYHWFTIQRSVDMVSWLDCGTCSSMGGGNFISLKPISQPDNSFTVQNS